MKDLHITLVQYDMVWEDTVRNLSMLEALLRDTMPTDLIVLPEMFNTGFSMNPEKTAEKEDGQTVAWLLGQSKRLNTAIMGSMAITESEKYYNRCFVVNKGQIIAKYDKRFLFSNAHEDVHFTPGISTITFELEGWVCKPLICYDLRFPTWCYHPEGVDVLIFIASWPEARLTHWDSLLTSRAIENQSYCVGVNRTGVDGYGLKYPGHSAVYNPMGEVVCGPAIGNKVVPFVLNYQEITHFRYKIDALGDYRRMENQ